MISDRELEIINKLLDLTEKEHDKIWFFSSTAPYVISEKFPPHLKEKLEESVAPIEYAMGIQYFLRLFEVPELREIYENIKGFTEKEKEKEFVYFVNIMIEKIARSVCDVIEKSEGRKADSKLTLALYKCYHPKTGMFYLTTYITDHYEPPYYHDFSFYLTRDKFKAYELYVETKRKHVLQRKTSTEKAESVQML
jgi:hypothetical protein